LILRIGLTTALCLTGLTAAADETRLMACTFKDGATQVSVTLDDGIVRYAYGPTGQAPDLALSVPAVEVDYIPWAGIGRSIWEAYAFRNGDYRYEVGMSFDRDPESVAVYGGITITKGSEEIARLTCDEGSGYFVYDGQVAQIKQQAGLCVEHGDPTRWVACG